MGTGALLVPKSNVIHGNPGYLYLGVAGSRSAGSALQS